MDLAADVTAGEALDLAVELDERISRARRRASARAWTCRRRAGRSARCACARPLVGDCRAEQRAPARARARCRSRSLRSRSSLADQCGIGAASSPTHRPARSPGSRARAQPAAALGSTHCRRPISRLARCTLGHARLPRQRPCASCRARARRTAHRFAERRTGNASLPSSGSTTGSERPSEGIQRRKTAL